MARGINFVANRRKRLTTQQKQDEKLFGYAVIGIIVVFILFLISVGVRFFFVYRVNALEEAQVNTRKAIQAQEQVEKEYNVFAHKLRALSDLFGKRQDKQEAMVYFSQVFGPQIIISGIDYTADKEDIVSFTLTAPSVFDLENVFTVLDSEEVTSKYGAIERSNLSRGDSGLYSIKLTIVLDSGEALEKAAAAAQENADSVIVEPSENGDL